jgi:hypothetical protein
MAQQVALVTFRKPTRMPVGRDQLLNVIAIALDPFELVLSLCNE